MKKRLNIITAILGLAFCLHTFSYFADEWYTFASSFMEGYRDGSNAWEKEDTGQEQKTTLYLSVVPEKYGVLVDSVYNAKTEAWLPNRITSMAVTIDKDDSIRKMDYITMAIGFVAMAIILVILFFFIDLILSVNHSVIFDKANIRSLRIIGTALLLLFLLTSCIEWFDLQTIRSLIEVPGYSITGGAVYSATSLILGIVSFLIAEIFAIGLRLKEEQDLTI